MALFLRFMFCATLLYALSVHDGTVFAKAPDGEKPSEVDKIREQVSKLNAPDFTTRDEAFRFLKGKEKAIPLLRLAAESKDLEGAKRAKSLLSAALNARYQRLLSEVLAKGEEAELDLLVELIGARREPLSDKEWGAVFSIATALKGKAERKLGKEIAVVTKPAEHFVKRAFFEKETTLNLIVLDESLLVNCGLYANRLVCRPVASSVVLCGSDFESSRMLGASMVICCGSVKPARPNEPNETIAAHNSIIVSASDIFLSDAANCLILAGGNVKIQGELVECVVLARQDVSSQRQSRSFVAGQQDSLQPLARIIDPSFFGIDVVDEGGILVVTGKKGPENPSNSYFQAGDRIITVGEQTLPSRNVFSSLLRRAFVEGSDLRITVVRQKKAASLAVPFLR